MVQFFPSRSNSIIIKSDFVIIAARHNEIGLTGLGVVTDSTWEISTDKTRFAQKKGEKNPSAIDVSEFMIFSKKNTTKEKKNGLSHSFKIVEHNKSRWCDRFDPSFVKIWAILVIFRPSQDFQKKMRISILAYCRKFQSNLLSIPIILCSQNLYMVQ